MRDPDSLIVLGSAVASLVAVDLAWVLGTGRARCCIRGTVTRQKQPGEYRRYVSEGFAILVLWFAVFTCAVLS